MKIYLILEEAGQWALESYDIIKAYSSKQAAEVECEALNKTGEDIPYVNYCVEEVEYEEISKKLSNETSVQDTGSEGQDKVHKEG